MGPPLYRTASDLPPAHVETTPGSRAEASLHNSIQYPPQAYPLLHRTHSCSSRLVHRSSRTSILPDCSSVTGGRARQAGFQAYCRRPTDVGRGQGSTPGRSPQIILTGDHSPLRPRVYGSQGELGAPRPGPARVPSRQSRPHSRIRIRPRELWLQAYACSYSYGGLTSDRIYCMRVHHSESSQTVRIRIMHLRLRSTGRRASTCLWDHADTIRARHAQAP